MTTDSPGGTLRRSTCTLADAAEHLKVLLAARLSPPAPGVPRPVIDDYDDAGLAALDWIAQAVVVAPGISPRAAQTLSTLRHSIAQILRIRREAATQPQPAHAQPPAPPSSSDGGRPVGAPRTPAPGFPPPTGRQMPTPTPIQPTTAPAAPAWTF